MTKIYDNVDEEHTEICLVCPQCRTYLLAITIDKRYLCYECSIEVQWPDMPAEDGKLH